MKPCYDIVHKPSGSHFENVKKVLLQDAVTDVSDNIEYKYSGWFKLHILLNFIYENIVFRCTIPLIEISCESSQLGNIPPS